MKGKTFWFRNNRVSVGIHYYSCWQRGGLCAFENGGRREGECLDITVIVGKLDLNLTFWRMTGLARLIEWIPRRGKRGFHIGLTPVGEAG